MVYLKADASGGTDSYLVKKLATDSSGISEIFVHIDWYICGSLISWIAANPTLASYDPFVVWDVYNAGGASFPLSDLSTVTDYDDEGIFLQHATDEWLSDNEGNLSGSGSATSGSHSIDFHLSIDNAFEYKIDGITFTLTPSDLDTWIDQIDILTVGAIFNGGADSSQIAYITNVKVGTTAYGSTDILNDDFSGGDFSLWDDTIGTCSIVDTPCAGDVVVGSGFSCRSFHSTKPLPASFTSLSNSGLVGFAANSKHRVDS